jgi:hypothetical protein
MGDGLTLGYEPFLRGGCIHERGSDDAAHPRITMRQIVFFNTILSSKRFQGDSNGSCSKIPTLENMTNSVRVLMYMCRLNSTEIHHAFQ